MVALAQVTGWARRHPRPLLAAIALATLTLGAAAPFTRWDANPELLTLAGSPELQRYREFLKRFGSDELIVVGFEDRHLLRADGLARLRDLADALWNLPDVESVASLDTLYAVDVGPFGPFAKPIVPQDLTAVPSPQDLARAVRALPLARDTLLDEKGTTTTLVVRPHSHALGFDARSIQRKVLAGVKSVLAEPRFAGVAFHLAGAPVFNSELERMNKRDAALFTPLALVLLTVVLGLALRSIWAVGMALACVIGTIAIVRGAMTLLGVPLNTTTSLLPPLLVVVSVSISLHVLVRYRGERAQGLGVEAAVRATEAGVMVPAALTALTTAIGFASLVAARIPSLRTFGLFAALGVGTSFLLGGVGLPAVLRLVRPKAPLHTPHQTVDRWLLQLRRVGSTHSHAVSWTSALLALIACVGLMKIRVATHDGDFFPPDHALNRAYRFIESRLSGVTPLEVMVKARTPGGIRTPEALETIEALQDMLEAQPETVRGVSIVDWIDQARNAIETEGERAQPLDVGSLERAAFVLEATSSADLPYWIQDGWSVARIASRSIALDSRRNDALLQRLEQLARDRIGPDGPLTVTFTGLVPVFARMEEYLLHSQIQSFGIALVSVFLVFAVLFRSLWTAGVALLPNLIPILLTLGLMGYLGIPLDVVTVMVASVNLGIIVDDTIHLLHTTRAGLRSGLSPEVALDRAVAKVGRAVVFTSIILAAGFCVLVFSDFRPTARFGALTGVTVLSALVADLVFLPALVRDANPFRSSWRRPATQEAA